MKKPKKNYKDYVCKNHFKDCGSSSGVYCLGVIGAAVYYISTATSFWIGVWGVIKAFVWPAFFVYEIFKSFEL